MNGPTLCAAIKARLPILLALACLLPATAGAARITVINLDGPGEGFNDPTPFTAVGGNTATTLGQARLNAFQFAANRVAQYINSPVGIRIGANFDPLGGDALRADLGGTNPSAVFRDFQGALRASTWYVQSVADKLYGDVAGRDICTVAGCDPSDPDVDAVFNSDVDGATALGGSRWYYGLDGNPPSLDIDFVTVVTHELVHGLGFFTLVDLITGAKFNGFDDAYMVHLHHNGAQPADYPSMLDEERRQANVAGPDLVWNGPAAGAMIGSLTAGLTANQPQIYAPNPVELGSSIAHFGESLAPDQLMEPFYLGPNHDLGLGAPLLSDVGWGATNAGTGSADLAVSIEQATETAETFTYTVSVSNDGPNIAVATVLTNFLPTGATLGSVSPAAACSTANLVVSCELGDLDPAATQAVTLVVHSGITGAVVNSALVNSITDDPVPANNNASATAEAQAATVAQAETSDGGGGGGGGGLSPLSGILLLLGALGRRRR